MLKIVSMLALLVCFNAKAQDKKVIDHTDFHRWKTIKNSTISNDGKYIAYQAGPEKGDGYLYIYNTTTKKLDSVHRGISPVFSGGSGYLAFKIRPGHDTLRTCELQKIKKAKWPKDSLGLYLLGKDSLVKIPKLRLMELNDENDWGVFSFQHNKLTNPPKVKRWYWFKKNRPKPYSSKGGVVMVYNPAQEERTEFKDIRKFQISEDGNYVALTVHRRRGKDSTHLTIYKTASNETWVAPDKWKSVEKLVFNEQETSLAFC